jgi:hypothetical protein
LGVFARLFAKEPLLSATATTEQQANSRDADKVREQQSSLEQRLTQLNHDLPQGFKTSEQRMREINRGLNRLGFSLYSAADEGKKIGLEPPKSEMEQVHDIIAQAKDEVAMLGTTTGGNNAEGAEATSACKNVDDVSSGDDSDLLNDSVDDSCADTVDQELTQKQMIRIRECAVDAQAQLAQLIELLAIDPEGDAEIEFEPSAGKRALTLARKFLAKANREWQQAAD